MTISCTVKICADLTVIVLKNHSLIPKDDLKWILLKNKLCRWSQSENLVSHYGNSGEPTFQQLFTQAMDILNRVSENVSHDF